MTPMNTGSRRGATLVELLVVMAIISALGLLVLAILPNTTNTEMALRGASEVQSTCKNAQAMAAAARLPRGVRFLTLPGTQIASEMQYLESPPVLVPNPQVLVGGVGGPRVDFQYVLAGPPAKAGDPPQGTVLNRHCYIYGLNPDQTSQILPGATLILPALGAFSQMSPVSPGSLTTIIGPAPPSPPPPAMPNPALSQSGIEVMLQVYPDALLGGATAYRTYHFGIYGPPIPLLAEPTVPLPKNIIVDLSLSYPTGQPSLNYDLLFAPSGLLLTTTGTATSSAVTGNTGVFLWVRDFSKIASMAPIPPTPPWTFTSAQFRLGGEQQIVGIRNGFVGTAPVLWPTVPSGANLTYPVGQDPYTLARVKLN